MSNGNQFFDTPIADGFEGLCQIAKWAVYPRGGLFFLVLFQVPFALMNVYQPIESFQGGLSEGCLPGRKHNFLSMHDNSEYIGCLAHRVFKVVPDDIGLPGEQSGRNTMDYFQESKQNSNTSGTSVVQQEGQ